MTNLMRFFKMKVIIQLFIVFCFSITDSLAQVVKLGNLDVNVNEIPLNRPLHIKDLSASEKDGIENIAVFKSDNKKYFTKAINSYEAGEGVGYDNFDEKSLLELYDIEGNLVWKKELDKFVSYCKISDDGKFCHVILSETDHMEMDVIQFLLSLDESGNKIHYEERVGQVYPNADKSIIYYLKIIDNNRYLTCKDFNTNGSWKQQVCDNCSIGAVSGRGNNVSICSSTSGIYSFNRNCELIWRDTSLIGGQASLSPEGDYLLKGFDLYNNNNGELLFSLKESIFNANRVDYIDGCFVKNGGNKIVVVGWCGSRQNRIKTISIFEINGTLIRNLSFDEKFKAFFIDCVDNGNSTFDLYLYNKFIKRIHYKE
ncbi:hypothetical protein [Saccharicrinis aurantiacus]|uniref:hypothetical protein n=1 Tax=Saccharicrinis aurantiacus TaxID=1849719 RepID=UPI001C9E4F96|nr:hypothetical protein [Saccharicrinis aurantiacus]